jgi:hypothetical protein
VAVTFGADGSGTLAASTDRVLYAAVHHLVIDRLDHDIAAGGGTLTLRPAFAWNRSCYDLFLTQEGRVQRGLNPESYVRRLAESGFTHVEVNALAWPMGLETGPAGEVYPMFYTYCPALDQFVRSSLNDGLYPPTTSRRTWTGCGDRPRWRANTVSCRGCSASSRARCRRSSSRAIRCCAVRAWIIRSGRSSRATR